MKSLDGRLLSRRQILAGKCNRPTILYVGCQRGGMGARDAGGGVGVGSRTIARLQHGRPNPDAFGTSRLLRPADLLHPTGDRLLGLRRPAKFRSFCRDYLLGCLAWLQCSFEQKRP